MTIPQNQNSDIWLEWRKLHIGASEIPIIMGKSKWATPFQLWKQKIGFSSGPEDNWAMKRGRDLEPIVRRLASSMLNLHFVPHVLVHKELEWASASLDGIDWSDPSILEIKCPGLEDHKCAESGKIPEHYWPQVQWQLFCSGIKVCYYVSYYENKNSTDGPSCSDIEVVKVEFDEEYINEVLPVATEFYRCVVEMEEPPKNEKDYIDIVSDEFEEDARQWKAAHEMSVIYAEKEKYFKDRLISHTDDSNCRGYGVLLTRVNREGSVNWKELMKDLSNSFPDAALEFSPDSYRNEQIGYWKITKEKGS